MGPVASAGGRLLAEFRPDTGRNSAPSNFEFIDFTIGDFKSFRYGVRTSLSADEGEGNGRSGRETGSSGVNVLGYNDAVKQLIERNRYYPVIARKRRIRGQVTVTFTIVANGGIKSLAVKKTSGYDILDTAALRTVNDAAPYPPPGESLGLEEVTLTVPIVYEL